MSSPWKPTAREAKKICVAVIEQAMKDLKHPPVELGTYWTEEQRKNAEERHRRVERDRASARVFFFSDDRNFRWMCEGLGGDVEAARKSLRKQMEAA